MKVTTTILLLISSLTSFSQLDKLVGEYYLQMGSKEKHLIEYKLRLNQDGTFLFHSYSNNKIGIPPEVNKYGKGKWSADDTVISFYSDKENDFDKKKY